MKIVLFSVAIDRMCLPQVWLFRLPSVTLKFINIQFSHSDWTNSLCNPLSKQHHTDINCFLTNLATVKLIIIGKLNASIGNDVDSWKDELVKYGVGKCKSNV